MDTSIDYLFGNGKDRVIVHVEGGAFFQVFIKLAVGSSLTAYGSFGFFRPATSVGAKAVVVKVIVATVAAGE